MIVKTGHTPIAIRQISTNALTGVQPQGSRTGPPVENDVVFDTYVDPDTKIIAFSDPEDHSNTNLDQGGLFDFSLGESVAIKEIRALAAMGNITVVVGDRNDTAHDFTVNTPAAERVVFDNPIIVLASQVLKITTASGSAGGFLDVYAVKAEWY